VTSDALKRYCPLASVVVVPTTVPLSDRVTVAPLTGVSPGFCRPLPSLSTQTRLPISIGGLPQRLAMAPRPDALPNDDRLPFWL
jgi:hypothetical protein